MINPESLRAEFQTRYGREPRIFRAPGRVNLIGEHTDYNGGFVLPMAIEHDTFAAAAARDDRKIRVRSVNLDEAGEIDLNQPEKKMRGSWLDFVEGVARVLERENGKLRGADLLVASNVPTGAGLSSSAALEISVGLALTEISRLPLDKVRLALAGQAAEHEFVGARVGIMDQFISALGRKGHALLIDCRNLQAEQVPFAPKDAAIVICDSKVKHKLAASEYNTRRAECETAVEILREFLPDIEQLRDVSVADFEHYGEHLPETIRKRCRHVVMENERTLNVAEALRENNYTEFGRLMFLSHASLRDDYEVSCRELDLLVKIAGNCTGVLGARMTGGGFGGSTVNLVRRENLDEVIEKISFEYERQIRIKPSIYTSGAADGASEIIL
ncbi:MAG: Galactokinase [uncultured Pyrinomonadaceae bacterium]|uniref:Galactokinase n=1 Tax=uncultured Pyrinomonadaceae bacterium TaxID=2283094 RepID=A0A6J4N5Q7_9BACT|nr:MAG: Galactokinase [uncultured Pyrinomonadaceae bacterium]